ncbi:MAG: alanine racemase, partial [Verrucomicrobia bacterium]|nr:alanine racemase [Verrucomicrobiota bacterium]
NLGTLRQNYRKIADTVAPCRVIGVLKANAYGLGVERIAAALKDAGCAGFGVAELNEALSLRECGLPVQILGGVLAEEIPPAVEAGIVLPITDVETASRISRAAGALGQLASCQFLIDTGMGRLGIPVQEAATVIRQTMALSHLNCQGIYSHFPVAYRSGSEYTNRQIDAFLELLSVLKDEGVGFSLRHMANSDAINSFPRSYRDPFNAVRTGINLHGSFETEGQRSLDLQPVLTLKTRLTAVRKLPKGTHIGYGCSYRLPHDMLVGTISAGYADGLPLALSNRGHVLIHGTACQVLGRVSMDYTTVSLNPVPDAACGDEVVCLGGHGPAAITVEDWASLKGTHSYEIICSFGSRVERRYVE